MQKKPSFQSAPNGKHSPVASYDRMDTRAPHGPAPASVLGRAALLRHPALGRGARPIAALIVGTYEVDDRYVIVQAFPIGRSPVQFADVQLLDDDPGETNEPVAWLVI